MNRVAAAIALALIAVGAPARAAPPVHFSHGMAIYPDDLAGEKAIYIVIDKNALLDSFTFWKEQQALRSEVTETKFRSHPYTFAALFALYGVSGVLHGETSMLSGLPTKILAELVEPDLYGHPSTQPMFSFTFTSEMASKIDWDGFEAESFQTIAPDFRYSVWFESNYRGQPPE